MVSGKVGNQAANARAAAQYQYVLLSQVVHRPLPLGRPRCGFVRVFPRPIHQSENLGLRRVGLIQDKTRSIPWRRPTAERSALREGRSPDRKTGQGFDKREPVA